MRAFVLLALVIANSSTAKTSVNIGGNVDEMPVPVALLEDKTDELTIADVVSRESEFIYQQPGSIDLSSSHSAYWGRFEVYNPENSRKSIFLAILPSFVDRFELYTRDTPYSYKRLQTGDQIPINQHSSDYRETVLNFIAPPGKSIYYFKVKNRNFLSLTLSLFDANSQQKMSRNRTAISSLLIGIFIAMIIYNTILWLRSHSSTFGYYVFYLTSFLFVSVANTQYAALYFFPDSTGGLFWQHAPIIGTVCIGIFSCLFTRSFLNMDRYLPKLSRVLLGVAIFFTCLIPVVPFIENQNIIKLIYQIFAVPLMIYSGIQIARQGFRPAIFYLIAWSAFIVGISVWFTMLLGFIPFKIYLSYAPLYGAALECILFALAIGDKVFLEQIQSKKEIESLNNKLYLKIRKIREQEKSRTIFFNNTSHELRTPLNGIIGYLELINRRNRFELPDELKDMLNKVSRLTNGLKNLVDNILEVARSRSGNLKLKPEKIILQSLADDIETLCQGLQKDKKDVQFRLNIPKSLKTKAFVTDQNLIKTIAINLIGNANKFKKPDIVCVVDISLSFQNGKLKIEVSDTGIGIKEKDLDVIFEEFKQLDESENRKFEGSGLGLNLIKKIVELMDGEILVTSAFGQGSCFTVILPELTIEALSKTIDLQNVTKEHTAEYESDVEIAPQDEIRKSQRGEHILIVDDHMPNLETLAMLMSDYGYKVSTALNGWDALKTLEHTDIHLVLLDLMMPGMTGDDVLKAIRETEKGQSIPVIFLSAKASHENQLAGLQATGDDYLAKPVDSNLLLEKVRNILDRVHEANEMGKKSQLKRIKKILDNIRQGILTFDDSLKIDKEFSAFLAEFYEASPNQVVGKNVMDFIFRESGLSKDEYSQACLTLTFVVGEKLVSWEMNRAKMPTETTIKVNDTEKTISLEWTPIVNEKGITERVMLAMHDLTEKRNLEARAEAAKDANKRLISMISELVSGDKETIKLYLYDAHKRIMRIKKELVSSGPMNSILRDIHTIKGGARSLKYKNLVEASHTIEEFCLQIQKGDESYLEEAEIIIDNLNDQISEYLSLFKKVLGQENEVIEKTGQTITLHGIISTQLNEVIKNMSNKGLHVQSVKCLDSIIHWQEQTLADVSNMIMHGLNNAVDHGYVRPFAKGIKLEKINIEIVAYSEGDRAFVEIKDQGAGFDLHKIKQVIGEKGTESKANSQDIINSLFIEGISTADQANVASGRGLGLPSIQATAHRLGGSATLAENHPQGAILKIELPMETVCTLNSQSLTKHQKAI